MEPIAMALAMLVALLWGVGPVLQKLLLRDLPFEMVFVAGAVFYLAAVLVYALCKRRALLDAWPRLTVRHAGILALFALLSTFLGGLLFVIVLGRMHNNTTVVTALTYTAPIVTALCAALVLGEQMSLGGAGGVLLIIAGVCLLTLKKQQTTAPRG
jgi:drug/metabolite transporter (DMT)-like permease